MRPVWILPAVSLALHAVGLGGQEARTQPLAGDALQAVFAAVEQYVGDHASGWSRAGQVTLVLAPATTGVEDAPPDRWVSRAPEPRAIALSPHQVDRLRLRSGVALKTCGSLKRGGGTWHLCGIPQPWHWLQVSNPWVDGDHAQVVIRDTWMEFGPDRRPEGSGNSLTTEVYLAREGEEWHVVRSVVIGVT